MSHRAIGEQLDLLAEHFREHAVPKDYEEAMTHTAVAPDKHGNIIYLGISHGNDEHEVRSYRQGGDGGYSPIGYMSTMQETPGDASTSKHEVGDIWVNQEHRRQGVGTAMYKYGRQFLDVRHSGIRSDDGSMWAHSVGGLDMDGVDTSTYRYEGEW